LAAKEIRCIFVTIYGVVNPQRKIKASKNKQMVSKGAQSITIFIINVLHEILTLSEAADDNTLFSSLLPPTFDNEIKLKDSWMPRMDLSLQEESQSDQLDRKLSQYYHTYFFGIHKFP
jgi:hypothetical protein